MKLSRLGRRGLTVLAAAPLIVSSLVVAAPASASAADVDAVSGRLQTDYTAKPLPTVQVNGVVWDQLVVGDVVYVTGQFTSACPAGAKAGVDETPRSNILAYDLNTGELIQDFAPVLNNTGRSLAVSDDGKTLYVGGSFDKVDGAWHGRLAAFDLAKGHGQLISSFKPMFSTTVNTIDVHGSTVYAGGAFSTVNGTARAELAAVSADKGTLLDWTASAAGTFTGMNQAAYNVTGTGDYLLLAGEFTQADGTTQQGLVRYPRRTAGGSSAPESAKSELTLRAVSQAAGTVNLGLPAARDRDSSTITYALYRDGDATPITTRSDSTRSWLPLTGLSYTDTGVSAGTHTYYATVTDGDGTVTRTPDVTVSDTATGSAYDAAVLGDGALHLWRLDDTGTTLVDGAGAADMRADTGVSTGVTGARKGSTAVHLDGTSKATATAAYSDGDIQTFTEEAWVRTSATDSGTIMGYRGDANNDRSLYFDTDGRIRFGTYVNGVRTVSSPNAYNDGQWHHVVGTLGAAGLHLYVDGAEVASNAGTWRLGVGVNGWPGASSTGKVLNGDVDDAAVYPTQLSAEQVAAEYKGATETAVTPHAGADCHRRAHERPELLCDAD